MSVKINNELNKKTETQKNINNEDRDDAIILWEQYQKQLNKKKIGSSIFVSIVLFIVVILVFIGLYIILSTNSPLSGS